MRAPGGGISTERFQQPQGTGRARLCPPPDAAERVWGWRAHLNSVQVPFQWFTGLPAEGARPSALSLLGPNPLCSQIKLNNFYYDLAKPKM